jgi:hypothetical protein
MTKDAAIFLVQAVHTAVFGVVSLCVLYVLRCGVTGRASAGLLRLCIAIPGAIGVFWLVNGRECLLSSVVYRLSSGDRSVPDILLPAWFARWIMAGTTLVLSIGVALVVRRELARQWTPTRGHAGLDTVTRARSPAPRLFQGRRSFAASVAAGFVYAIVVYAAGFALGAIRVFLVAPRIGPTVAVALEAPIILAVSWRVSQWAAARFGAPATASARATMGGVAFATLMLAEFGVAFLVFGRSIEEIFAGWRAPAGAIGLAAQIAFAAFPLLQIGRAPDDAVS